MTGISKQKLADIQAKAKEVLLKAMRKTGILKAACEALDMHPERIYRWRNQDPAFNREIEALHEAIIDQIEDVGIQKALDGDTGMIRFYLQQRRKERYGKTDIVVTHDQTTEIDKVEIGQREPSDVVEEQRSKLIERLKELPNGSAFLEALQQASPN